MSSLNAEYNVMSSVFTKDVYQRLFNTEAAEKRLLVVARWSTLVIGALITVGAIYIEGFGGAFEANKLFTGIFCIPIGIPLVLGIVSRKPNAKAAIITISAGIVVGIVLNALPEVDWGDGNTYRVNSLFGSLLSAGLWADGYERQSESG